MKIATIFTNHMVLQRGIPIRVFGSGDGEVTVRFLGETVRGKSENGKWCVFLSSREAGGPYEMEVDLNNEKTVLHDVLIGDVFLACGQSNMEMPLFRTESGFEDSEHCENENIRYFDVPRRYKKGKDNYGYNFEDLYVTQEPWKLCTKDTALHFTAIGHYFAAYIQKEIGVPVGIISCNWGGRRIEAFIEPSYFEELPSLKKQMQEFTAHNESLDMEQYENEYAHFSKKLESYIKTRLPEQFERTKKLGVYAAVAKIDLSGFPNSPKGPYDSTSPATLWNNMFSEIVPFGVRALLWYQGESNADDADYCEKYLIFLKCLREQFACSMDAYAVELAPYMGSYKMMNETHMDAFVTKQGWAHLREQQQEATVKGERNYLVTTQELGELFDIHPKRKKELSHRLAKKVLCHSYGMDIAADQPVYRSVEFKDGKTYITLDNADGLYGNLQEVNIYIAGDDHVLQNATVEILPDNRLCVYSEKVENPVLVRYGFGMFYFGQHIYNGAGLPLAPFRTDK